MKRTPSLTAYSALAVTTAILASTQSSTALAQGCVAVRGGGMCTLNHAMSGDGVGLGENQWLASVGYRFFKSDRHFSGGHEPRNAAGLSRFQQGTEVINYSSFLDASITYQFSPRYSATLTIPFVYHTRSAPYEHYGVVIPGGRDRETTSGGLADIRLTAGAWIWDPSKMPKGNIQVSIGLKAPTGDFRADDLFYRNTGSAAAPNIVAVRRNVDQSVQPGDGGWGVSFELNSYREFIPRWIGYAQAYYLFNPANVNGTKSPTARTDAGPYLDGAGNVVPRGTPGAVAFDNGMSITDQYMFRTGMTWVASKKHGIALSLGGRMEGIPVEDLNGNAGDREGFRRPGYAISIEPGISWMPGKWNVAVTVPWVVSANRERSYWDERGAAELAAAGTPQRVHGDAAFADYLVTLSVSRMF
jgi:hypothetical protein